MGTLTLTFKHDGKNTDGTPFDASQFAGVEYSIDGSPLVSVPSAFSPSGDYSLSTTVDVPEGSHAVTVVVKHNDGTASDPSAPSAFIVAPAAKRVPSPPFGLSVSYVK